MENYIEYAPIIVIVLLFLLQQKIFVTPEQIEKKHREILEDVSNKFVQLPAYLGFREQVLEDLHDVKAGINDLKEAVIKKEIP